MDIELAIMRMGLISRTQSIVTPLDGANETKLGGQLQTDVGLIYGFNIYADGVTPDNLPLITSSDASNIYLQLIKGADQTIFPLRLDDLLNVVAGSPVIRTQKYTPLIVPWYQFSLDKSVYANPLQIGSGAVGVAQPNVYLNFYYLNMDDYDELLKRGPDYGIATPQTTMPCKQDTQATAAENDVKVPNALMGRKKGN